MFTTVPKVKDWTYSRKPDFFKRLDFTKKYNFIKFDSMIKIHLKKNTSKSPKIF